MSRDDQPQPQALIEWKEAGTVEGLRQVLFRVNLGIFTNPMQNELQIILDCTRLAWAGSEVATNLSSASEGHGLQVHPAHNRRMAIQPLRLETRQWLLRSAFRDAMEVVQNTLEHARRVLALWSMLGIRKGEDYNARVEEEGIKFHRLGLQPKLDHLQAKYGFELPTKTVEVVSSLNKARNCIVHRFGHVTTLDTEGSDSLKAIWEAHEIMGGHPDKPRKVGLGETLTEGEYLWVTRSKKIREFPLGSQMELTMKDLNEICNTIHLFATQVRESLKEKQPPDQITGPLATNP